MASLEEMIRILQPTGIYGLEEGSAVHRELQTYASAIDAAVQRADEVLREVMPQTACAYGLDSREHLTGCCVEKLSVEERRKRIIYRLSVLPDDFNDSGVQKALFAAGYYGKITPDPENTALIFEPLGSGAKTQDYLALLEKLYEILPVKYGICFAIPAPTWNESDAKNESFDERDKNALPWDFYMN